MSFRDRKISRLALRDRRKSSCHTAWMQVPSNRVQEAFIVRYYTQTLSISLCNLCSSSSRLPKCPANASTCSLKLCTSFRILSKFPPRSISSPSFSLLNSRLLKSSICSNSRFTRADLLDLFDLPRRRDRASASADSIFSFKVASSLWRRTFSQSVSFTEEKSVPTVNIDHGLRRSVRVGSLRGNLRDYIGNFLHRHQVSINSPPQNHPFCSKQLHSIHLSPSPISQEHLPPSLSRLSSSTNHTQYPPDSTSLSDLLVYSLES